MTETNVSLWIKSLIKAGVLKTVTRGFYANMVTLPVPTTNELAHIYQPGAMVSLHTVLGTRGILNNPTTITFAMVPVETWPARVERNEVKTNIGLIKYHFVPERIVNPPRLDKNDYSAMGTYYPVATPEKALADWLYLARNKRAGMGSLPLDVDLYGVDMTKLKRVCKEMGVAEHLVKFLQEKKEHDESENVRYNMSVKLGF